jgi:NADPH-dependent curcumin reductase CurA
VKLKGTKIVLNSIPAGIPKKDDFRLKEFEVNEPVDGQFLAETIYLALDPYVRVTMVGRHFFSTPKEGEVPRGSTISRVIKSRNSNFNEGDLVVMESGMQSHSISDGREVHFVKTGSAPVTTALGILGMPGFTAYSALLGPAKLKKDDLVLVSAASGAVGSMVGQIASIYNARVIGIAGGEEKCEWAMNNASLDACIDRKKDDIDQKLTELSQNGVDIFFDNTGGDIQNIVLSKHLGLNSRVILSGMISQYNSNKPPSGPNLGNICKQRATIYGFVVYDFEHMRESFVKDAIN